MQILRECHKITVVLHQLLLLLLLLLVVVVVVVVVFVITTKAKIKNSNELRKFTPKKTGIKET